MSSEDNYFPLDEDSYRRFQQLEKKTPPPSPSKKNGGEKSAAAEPWKANPPLAVDPGDVQVLFRAEKEEGPGEVTSTFRKEHKRLYWISITVLQEPTDVKSKAYYLPSEDSLLVLVSFEPVAASPDGGGGGLGHGHSHFSRSGTSGFSGPHRTYRRGVARSLEVRVATGESRRNFFVSQSKIISTEDSRQNSWKTPGPGTSALCPRSLPPLRAACPPLGP